VGGEKYRQCYSKGLVKAIKSVALSIREGFKKHLEKARGEENGVR
jgi:hypothetical protein